LHCCKLTFSDREIVRRDEVSLCEVETLVCCVGLIANYGSKDSSIVPIFILLVKTRTVARGKVSQSQTKFFKLISTNCFLF
jgi:hypothetical protein